MSFRCGLCEKTTLNGVKPKRVVLEFRRVRYPSKSVGTEIVKEADYVSSVCKNPTETGFSRTACVLTC